MKLIAILVIFVSITSHAFELVVQRNSPVADSVPLIKRNLSFLSFSNAEPDRSYKTVWVRMFPILSRPSSSEPFPVTQNRNLLRLYNSRTLDVISNGQSIDNGKEIRFDFSKSEFYVDGRKHDLKIIWIKPANTSITTTARWDRGLNSEVGIELRGEFLIRPTQLWRSPENLWSLINVVSVEEYLYAVLPSEMPLSFHREALKTQAVAARTYALFEMAVARGDVEDLGRETPPARNWDVDPTTWYQSYRGTKFWRSGKWNTIERPVSSDVVNATNGQVMVHDGRIIKAFFSANSGGLTCTATECFNWNAEYENPAYLQPVEDAPGIKNNNTGTWGKRANITPATITKKLRELELPTSINPQYLKSHNISETGRTWELTVVGQQGEITLDRSQSHVMKRLFGRIRGALFTLYPYKNGRQAVVGHGFGHGVGMSQVGANLFGKQGKPYTSILKHFYSGIEIGSFEGNRLTLN